MIYGKKIFLRAIEPSDTELMYRWENDISIWPVSGTLTPFSRHTVEQFVSMAHQDIYTNKQLRLAIDKAGSAENPPVTVGYIDLFDFEPAHLRAGVGMQIGAREGCHVAGGGALPCGGQARGIFKFCALQAKTVGLLVHGAHKLPFVAANSQRKSRDGIVARCHGSPGEQLAHGHALAVAQVHG